MVSKKVRSPGGCTQNGGVPLVGGVDAGGFGQKERKYCGVRTELQPGHIVEAGKGDACVSFGMLNG